MSNPVVSIDNIIPEPSDPTVARKQFSKIAYDSQRFFVYGRDEYASDMSLFNPEGKGERFFMTIPVSCVLSPDGTWDNGVKPDFVSEYAWDAVRASSSCFVTAVYSVMPKIIVPSDILVENGILSNGTPADGNMSGYYLDGVNKLDLFNWEIIDVNGGSPIGNYFKYASEGSWTGVKYVSFRAKDDKEQVNSITVKLSNPVNPPLGSTHDWLSTSSSDLVVGGAFCLMLDVIPSRGTTTSPENAEKGAWSINITFGDVEMVMSSAGEMNVRITSGDAGGNWTKVNLVEGRTKGGPPQQEQVDDRHPYIIVVYPTWNGIIVSSGVQEARTNAFILTPVLSSSSHVKKLKEASILMEPWSNGFDPTAPADVVVNTGSGGSDVSVDFGSSMTVSAQNCRFDIAYLPCFFCKIGAFDEWFVAPDDTSDITYDYNVYSIWTANGSAYSLSGVTVEETYSVGPVEDTHYDYIPWHMENDHFARVAGQLFGSILELEETNKVPIKNSNGSFNLMWTGGSPGDPSHGSWKNHIQAVNVTIGLDGSSGSITVDQYGCAGQDAVAIQSVGAITIDVTGGYGTQSGSIFKGIAMGIGRNRSSQGATWTIPLFGLEKKLDDIALINVPFFDGERLITVLDFLSRYSGITGNYAAANPLIQLSVSEDINVARFDWKSGTTVRTALDEVMEDTNHNYVVRDGMIYYYQLNGITGVPNILGPDWGGSYPGTKTVVDDQTPDFDDVRNEIVILGLEVMCAGEGEKIEGAPSVLRMDRRSTVTTPDIPWAKTYVEGIPGFTNLDRLSDYADKRQAQTSNYEATGRTTIPGNAVIRPYDRFNGAIVFSVSHNIDLQSKTWTTDLEFMDVTT